MGINILSFIIVLGVLIFFHELGHFLLARLFGVGVEKFSLGFGPKLLSKKIGLTDYRISAIPLGGYVKMVGEEPDEEIEPEKVSLSFTHKHVLKRICIVAAGPFFNMFLAIIIFFGLFQIHGTFIIKPVIGEVQEGMPAHGAGLKTGDEIISINGFFIETWEDMKEIIAESKGDILAISVKREESEFNVNIKPVAKPSKNIFGEDVETYFIGIGFSGDVTQKKLSVFESFSESVIQTYKITELTVISVAKLIAGSLSPKTLGGPIMIAQMAGDQAREGTPNLLFFIALISINLAILNILPIPVLDGGHLLFYTIELVQGRPVSIKIREAAQQGGMFILILLMIFVFYNDIARLIFN